MGVFIFLSEPDWLKWIPQIMQINGADKCILLSGWGIIPNQSI